MEEKNGWNGSKERLMRFVITMNMPSSNGYLVHQIIMEHPAKSVSEICKYLNDDLFIMGRQIYKRPDNDGNFVFVDRGDLVLNTNHIGKVQEYFDGSVDDPLGDRQRPPMRKRPQNTY